MAWTALADHAAAVVTVAEWNELNGETGNMAYLKAIADAPMKAQKDGGAVVGGRNAINFVSGAGITITVADDEGNDQVDVTLAASGSTVPDTYESSGSLSSYAVTLTADGSANVKGGWSQLVASTSQAITHMILIFSAPSTASSFSVDIATGAGYDIIVADMGIYGYSSATGPCAITIPVNITTATKVSARCSCSVSTSRTINVSALFGG